LFSHLVDQFPYFGLFALLILGGIGLPFPEDATLIICGLLISQGTVKAVPAVAVVYAGMLISDFLIFLAGNKYGQAIINHPVFRKFISSQRLSYLEQQFAKRGVLLIIVGRHLVGLRSELFITAGVMKMPPLKFLASDAFSSIITMAVMIGAGYQGGNSLEIIGKDITRLKHVAVVLLTVALIVYVIYRYVKGRERVKKGYR
jgi:membrane protein DedA with SNARE-associated domain